MARFNILMDDRSCNIEDLTTLVLLQQKVENPVPRCRDAIHEIYKGYQCFSGVVECRLISSLRF